MPARLIIAYVLIALTVAAAALIVWWNVHHSRDRTIERNLARQRQFDAARAKRNDQDG